MSRVFEHGKRRYNNNKHINILNSISHQQNKDLNHREIPLYTHKVAKIEKIGVTQYQQMWSYWNPSFADRRISGTATLEKSLALPHKVSHTLPTWPAPPLFGIYPRGMEAYVLRNTCVSTSGNLIYKSKTQHNPNVHE